MFELDTRASSYNRHWLQIFCLIPSGFVESNCLQKIRNTLKFLTQIFALLHWLLPPSVGFLTKIFSLVQKRMAKRSGMWPTYPARRCLARQPFVSGRPSHFFYVCCFCQRGTSPGFSSLPRDRPRTSHILTLISRKCTFGGTTQTFLAPLGFVYRKKCHTCHELLYMS